MGIACVGTVLKTAGQLAAGRALFPSDKGTSILSSAGGRDYAVEETVGQGAAACAAMTDETAGMGAAIHFGRYMHILYLIDAVFGIADET